ncbi:MAG: SAM-dependent methyltransferase [Pseudomonadota bacterium]
MTALMPILLAQIEREGPMTIADYMAFCLHHPSHGYYATRDPFGAAGDFTTAPEISQMFGELLGLALAQSWLDQGKPAGLLAELGPGRGTLMADVLRATQNVTGLHEALQLCLVESSPILRRAQSRALDGHKPAFFDQVSDLPEAPLFLLANEFFDALPVRVFQRARSGWDEWRVGASGGQLSMGRSPAGAVPALANAQGEFVELCPAAESISSEIGRRIAQHGGVALIVDYGATESTEPSFQAVQAHQKIDPLSQPGAADLTAHVAFGPILRAAHPAIGFGPVDQREFLARLGIEVRAQQLAAGLTGAALRQHKAALLRLTDPEEMGTLFKVIGLAPPGAAAPPGMEPAP